MSWICVPDTEGSLWASDSLIPDFELSVTSKGKPTARPCSWSGWKRKPWTRLLFGRILEPSTADRGVAWWILSLRATRASPSPLPGSEEEPKTSDGSGQRSSEWSAKWDPGLSSWRTSEGISVTGSGKSSRAWPTQGSMRNGECSRQPMSGLPTGESGSSFWATPSSRDWKGVSARSWRQGNPSPDTLPDHVEAWLLGSQNAGLAEPPTASGTPDTASTVSQTDGPQPKPCLEPSLHVRMELGRKFQRNSGLLKPSFVEWMMGLPFGWTGFGRLGTEWSRWLSRMRSELSTLEPGGGCECSSR